MISLNHLIHLIAYVKLMIYKLSLCSFDVTHVSVSFEGCRVSE